MADLKTIISALRTKWDKAKLPTHEVNKGDLDAAKSKFPGLASDYLQILESIGFPDSEDAEGFRFWGVDELVSAAA